LATEQQIAKYRSARIVNASNLAVEHCAFNVKMFSDSCGKIRKAAERPSIPGDQFPFSGLDMGESTKAIDLQFKNELVGIERFNAA